MSQELLYTSAPHGLKPGSRGFCTVLSTQGMPAPLANGLEALSGYRPVFPSSDSRAHLNPVVRSHVILPVAGRSWHVLSRIADYGLDYSQRTNKLAHHVVLDPGELTESGPAHLIGSSAFMRTEWDEEAKLVPPKTVKKTPAPHIGVCRAWKELTGDAGWAGVLAESFLREPERPVFLLYEPGQDLLPLIAESIALLPPERRWDVTFSTYFTGLPQGVNCTWRCLLKGSPEANQSLRFPKALRIDLTGDSIGTASGGYLVEAARDGVPARFESQKHSAQPNSPVTAVTENDIPRSNSPAATDDSNTTAATSQPPILSGNVVKPYQLADKSHNSRPPGRRTLADVDDALANRRHSLQLTLAVVFAVLLAVSVGVGLIWSRLRVTKIPDRNVAIAQDPKLSPKESVVVDRTHQESINTSIQSPVRADSKTNGAVETPRKHPDDHDSAPPAVIPPAAKPIDDNEKAVAASLPNNAAPSPELRPAATQTKGQSPDLPLQVDIALSFTKGDATQLHTMKVDADPYSQIALWSPPEMFLELKKKPIGTDSFGKYSVRERSASQLATIESKSDRLGNVALLLTPIFADPKVKRLNWCQLEIPGKPAIVIRLHKPPVSLSKLETTLLENKKKNGEYQREWLLAVKGSEGHIPAMRVERLSLMFDQVEFAFETATDNSNQQSKSEAALILSCDKLDQRLKLNLTDAAKGELKPMQFKVSTLVTPRDDGSSGDISVVLTLTGWNKSLDSLAVLYRAEVIGVVNRVNALLKAYPQVQPVISPKSNLHFENQAKILVDGIDNLIKKLEMVKTTTPEQATSATSLKVALNKEKDIANRLETDVAQLTVVKGHFSNCSIKTASLYYETVSGTDTSTAPRKIYVVTDSER